jgi:hypothetical protein
VSSLHDRAAELAGRDDTADQALAELPPTPPGRLVVDGDPLPDFDEFEPGEGDPEQVPVHVAWNRLMRDVREIGKAGLFKGKSNRDGQRQEWRYRGADHVVNEFGPAMRRHGIIIAPIRIEKSHSDGSSKGGAAYRSCDITVTWTVMGPMGDELPFKPVSAAEAQDYADRSTTKAQTVALRTLLTTLAMVPTGAPDPESEYIERGEAPVRNALSYREEILDPNTSPGRMQQISRELAQHRQGNALVMNEDGQEEPIQAMCIRIGNQRFAPKPAAACDRCGGPHHSDACPTLDGGAS